VAGFAGATADAFTLFERFEGKLKDFQKNLAARSRRAGQGLAHRSLPAPPRALLVVADKERTLILSGTGDVVEPDEGVAASAAADVRPGRGARVAPALPVGARQIAEESLRIAGRICIYTNDRSPSRSLTQART